VTGKTKFALFGILVVAAGGVGVFVVAQQRERPVEVRIEDVGHHDLIASVTASGQVQPRTNVALSADITGRIVQLSVKEGDVVARGQFLLRIDPAQYEAAVQRAEAGLASAKAQAAQSDANATQAVRNMERADEMRASNAALVSDEQLEQLRTQVEITRALAEASRHAVDQAIAGVQDARNNLSKTVITAPMSGRITRLNIEEGETAIMGTLNRDAATLLTISDMSVLETRVRVDETDVARIEIGDSAVVQIDAFRDTTFLGKVVQIGNSSIRGAAAVPAGQDQVVDYQVTIQLLNVPGETRPDFSATARIITAARKHVLAIPIIALTVREHEAMAGEDSVPALSQTRATNIVGQVDQEGVFVVGDDNKVTFRAVKVGIAGERHFEVLSGLREGERIVAGTYQAIRSLRDGMLVRPAATDTTKMTGGK
jgi:HlyD family secretion protein